LGTGEFRRSLVPWGGTWVIREWYGSRGLGDAGSSRFPLVVSVHKRQTETRGTTYVVRWRDPRPKERTFRTKAEAERFERSVRHRLDVGTYRDPRLARITFKQWHDRWWPTVEDSDRAPTTITQYESLLRLHVLPHLGHRRLGELRRIDFEEWLGKLRSEGLSGSTIRTARTVASMVLTSAVDSGYIAGNPLAGLRLAKGSSTTRRALTAKQVEVLVKAFEERYRALVLVLAYGGLRPGEATALRRRHLDDLGQLTVEGGLVEHRGKLVEGSTKTRTARVVPLPATVVKELRQHLRARVPDDPEAPMFATPTGTRIRLSNFRNNVWDVARKRARLPDWVTPYVLRHTAASLMAQNGVPVTTAAAVLGHDPAIYLRTYAHLYPGDLQTAAQALDDARMDAQTGRRAPAVLKRRAGISRGRTRTPAKRQGRKGR